MGDIAGSTTADDENGLPSQRRAQDIGYVMQYAHMKKNGIVPNRHAPIFVTSINIFELRSCGLGLYLLYTPAGTPHGTLVPAMLSYSIL